MFYRNLDTAAGPEKFGSMLVAAAFITILAFLVVPLIVIVPLSFNAESSFTVTAGMLRLDPDAFSLKWYREIFEDPQWRLAFRNSAIVGVSATVLATALGTFAAIGLSRSRLPGQNIILAFLAAPLTIPIVIAASAIYFLFTDLGLTNSLPGLILAHTLIGAPFVVTTVLATLSRFDRNLIRASQSLGASHTMTFRRVLLPMIWIGVFSGALLAFNASLDEVVLVLFIGGPEQRTIPRQMWSGLREQISPTILAVATLLTILSVLLLLLKEALQHRADRLRGLQ
jgi:putative spermidine/putrescine transport system permease protein